MVSHSDRQAALCQLIAPYTKASPTGLHELDRHRHRFVHEKTYAHRTANLLGVRGLVTAFIQRPLVERASLTKR